MWLVQSHSFLNGTQCKWDHLCGLQTSINSRLIVLWVSTNGKLIALVVMECKAFKNRIKSDDFCLSTNIEVRRKKYMSLFECDTHVTHMWPQILYGESPANPTMSVLDLEAFGELGKSLPGVVSMVDSTFATPFLIQPIKYGVDVAIHSWWVGRHRVEWCLIWWSVHTLNMDSSINTVLFQVCSRKENSTTKWSTKGMKHQWTLLKNFLFWKICITWLVCVIELWMYWYLSLSRTSQFFVHTDQNW